MRGRHLPDDVDGHTHVVGCACQTSSSGGRKRFLRQRSANARYLDRVRGYRPMCGFLRFEVKIFV
jgi:hypothetical protein